ncbi:MAG: hypothetical protein KDD41_04925 [Flavobacteriales bacterium]|nr:hypothetical protein [Flavobacteriales bacterium]
MKRLLSTLLVALITTTVFAQQEPEATCFTKYAKVFEQRGAFEVEDSTYTNVVITIRKGTMADCFYGKVTVKNGSVDISSLALRFEDDTYEPLDFRFKYQEKPIKIVNGISNIIFTEEEELINVLFVKKIKPKKKKYAKAAEPVFDL